MSAKKILVVEDEAALVEALRYNLEKEGYTVRTATDGVQALEVFREFHPNLVLLDLMLPGLDGLEVCRIMRRESSVPLVMLTAKVSAVDKVVGLELGADDYVTKPFDLRELLARIKAVLRRAELAKEALQLDGSNSAVACGDLVMDKKRHTAMLRGVPLSLKPKEFDLLEFLVRNRSIVFSREALLERVWGYDFSGDSRTVDVHIRWLREKIEEDPSNPKRLVTVRGIGYKFEG